jgi:hypothetical protein
VSRGREGVRFNFCKDINEVLRLAIKHIDNNSSISRLLSQGKRVTTDKDLVQQQLDTLFKRTMNSVDKKKPKDLTTIILSMAKIVKTVREAIQMKRTNIYHQTLGNLLQRSNPFRHFAKAAERILVKFDARNISNLVYAYALVGYNPKLVNYHSDLFTLVGDHIVRLDSLTSFNPQNLSNIAWAYATLNEKHSSLLEKVGNLARLDDLAAFNSQSLANIASHV